MYTSPTSPNFSNAARRSSSRSSYDTLSIFTDTKFEMSGLFPRGRASSPSSPSRVARAPSRAVRRLSPSPAFASPVASPVAFASSAPSFARASSSSPFDIAQPRVAVSRVGIAPRRIHPAFVSSQTIESRPRVRTSRTARSSGRLRAAGRRARPDARARARRARRRRRGDARRANETPMNAATRDDARRRAETRAETRRRREGAID